MPAQIVEIPGVGGVEFPDSMSDAEVSLAAKKLHDEAMLASGTRQEKIAALTGGAMEGRGEAQRAEAIAHPVKTGAVLAISAVVPPVVSRALGAARSILPAVVGKVGETIEQPFVGGVLGGAEGYRQGGVRGALYGAATGAAGSSILGRGLRSLAARMKPAVPAVPESLVSPEAQVLRQWANVEGPATPMPVRMRGGTAPAVETQPVPTIELSPEAAALREWVSTEGATPMPARVTPQAAPQARPTPPPNPKAQAAAGDREVAPAGKVATPKAAPKAAPVAQTGDVSARYRQLSQKPLLSPQEAQELEFLDNMMRRQASQVGRSYAAGGAQRAAGGAPKP